MVADRRRRRRAVAPSRRGPSLTRIVILLVVSAVAVVLTVGVIEQTGKASKPYRATVNRGFAALARPLAAQSNQAGASLRTLLARAPTLTRPALWAELGDLEQSTSHSSQEFGSIAVPSPDADVTGCRAALAKRAGAVGVLAGALRSVLGGSTGVGGGDQPAAVQALDSSAVILVAADRDWAACRSALRRAPGGARLPASTWVRDGTAFDAATLSALVAAMVVSPSLAAVHDVQIVTLSTSPPTPLGAPDGVLFPTTSVRTQVVVADLGDVDEDDLHVAAVLEPPTGGPALASTHVTTSLAAGSSTLLVLAPMPVRPGSSYLLVVSATSSAPAASGSAASRSLLLQVQRAPGVAGA